MKPVKALDKITALGRELIQDPTPEVAALGAAILTIPISASEDDLPELLHLIFGFAASKLNQREAIRQLMDPNLN